MLFILSRSPYRCDLTALLRLTRPGDDLVLLSDGVTAGLRGSRFARLLRRFPPVVYALSDDVRIRGLEEMLAEDVVSIGYRQLVDLSERQSTQLTW